MRTTIETTTIAASHDPRGHRRRARARRRSRDDPGVDGGARERAARRRCRPRPPPRRSARAPRRRPRRRRRPSRAPRRTRRRRGERVLALDVRARSRAERRAVVDGERRAPPRASRPRSSSTGTFSTDVVGQLAEPADVGDDERLAERERADHRARRLAHRRVAQVDEHVAGRHQRPHALLRARSRGARRPRSARAARAGADVEALARGADEQQPRAGPRRAAATRTPRAAAGSACSCSGSRSSRSAGRPATSVAGSTRPCGQAGCGMRQSAPAVARRRGRARAT